MNSDGVGDSDSLHHMKVRLIHFLAWCSLLTCIIGAGWANGEEIEVAIDEALSPLSGMASDEAGGNAALRLITKGRLIGDEILPYFYGAGGALHEVNAERRRRVETVERALGSYAVILLDVMERSKKRRTLPNAAAQVLCFAPATANLKSGLLNLAADEMASPETKGEAYNVLFMLGMDDQAIRDEVIAKLALRDEPSTLAPLGAYLMEGVSTRWALAEGEAVWRSLLAIPFRPENYPARGGRQKLLANYNWGTEGLSRFGVLGAAHIPLLRARLAELNEGDEAEARVAEAIKVCINRLEGSEAPALAVSWKGGLLGVNESAMEEWKARESVRIKTH